MADNVEAKMKILDQLEKKEITAAEAERLLNELSKPAETEEPEVKTTVKKGKIFRIDIRSSDGDKVNVQVPIHFARTLVNGSKKFGTTRLSNIELDFEQIFDMIDEGQIGQLVNIESADGDTVKVYVD